MRCTDDTAAPSPPISLHLDMVDMQRAGEARASTATPLEGSARAPRLEAAASQSGVTGLHGNVPVRPSRLVGKLQFDETAVSVFRFVSARKTLCSAIMGLCVSLILSCCVQASWAKTADNGR